MSDQFIGILDTSGSKIDPEEHTSHRRDPRSQTVEVLVRGGFELSSTLGVELGHCTAVGEETLNAPYIRMLDMQKKAKRIRYTVLHEAKGDTLGDSTGVQIGTSSAHIDSVKDFLRAGSKALWYTSASCFCGMRTMTYQSHTGGEKFRERVESNDMTSLWVDLLFKGEVTGNELFSEVIYWTSVIICSHETVGSQ